MQRWAYRRCQKKLMRDLDDITEFGEQVINKYNL